MNKTTFRLEFKNNDNGKKYKIEAICNNIVYVRESEDHLLGFYFLVFWKDYPEEENIREPAWAI